MADPWTAERNVTPVLARALIAAQFPALADARVERCGLGWDNVVYRVVDDKDELYFRFPIRADADAGVAREIDWLPTLERLGLAVPRLRFVGKPSDAFAWSFFGYEPIGGQELGVGAVDVTARARLARPLARFLKTLHGRALYDDAVARALAIDPIGRLDLVRRARMTRERLATLRAQGLRLDYDRLDAALAVAEPLTKPPATAFVHGDLHFRHVIVTPPGELGGIIDWGDLHLNSPVVDLQIVFSALPPEARAAFWEEYGASLSEQDRLRTQAFAVFLNVALLVYAVSENLPRVRAEAELALSWIL